MLVTYFGCSCFRHSFWTPDLSLSLSVLEHNLLQCLSTESLFVALEAFNPFSLWDGSAESEEDVQPRYTLFLSLPQVRAISTVRFPSSNCGAINVDLLVWYDCVLHAWRLPPPALWGAADRLLLLSFRVLSADCTYISNRHILLPLSQRKVLIKNAESERTCVTGSVSSA